MMLSWQWDPRRFAESATLMAQLKAVPVDKVLRNAARDFAHGAYRATRSAAVRKTDFLQVPDKRDGRYYRAFRAAQAANERNHGGRHVLAPNMYVRGGMRWIRRRAVRRPGLRGGTTPNPPYPVAKGFARASWIGVFRSLGMQTQRPAASVPPAAVEIGQAEQARGRLDIVDRLSYIGSLDARDGIVAAGLARAESIIVRELDREARRMEALFK